MGRRAAPKKPQFSQAPGTFLRCPASNAHHPGLNVIIIPASDHTMDIVFAGFVILFLILAFDLITDTWPESR